MRDEETLSTKIGGGGGHNLLDHQKYTSLYKKGIKKIETTLEALDGLYFLNEHLI